mgnify:CR=1 FL=1
MDENKKLTWRQLRTGDQISGTEGNGSRSGFRAYVKEANPAYVTVEMWTKGGREEQLSSELMFLVPMTEDEFILKYNRAAGEIIAALKHRLTRDEIGQKGQWNSWVSSNPWELAQSCGKEKLKILGHCRDITPKKSLASGDLLDVGICAEDEDGDRFWCHFRGSDIERMTKMYERFQRYIKEGKIKEKNYNSESFDLLVEMEEN